MDEKPEPQMMDSALKSPVVPTGDPTKTHETERRGDWQGYDPTLLTALFDD